MMTLLNKEYVATSCWDGKFYAEHSSWQFRVASQALNSFPLPPKAKILDIGCGDGRFTKHLSELVPDGEILGLDPSTSMLAAAKNNCSSNLSFIQGNAIDLPFINQFNRIVAFNSLHWVPEIKISLNQIHKALLPGGQALILVAPTQIRHLIHRIIDQVAKNPHWNPYFKDIPSVFSFHSLAEWAVAIENANLIPENLKYIDASMDYPNKKSFAEAIRSWIPFGSIPEGKKSQYVQEVVESYLDFYPCGADGVVQYKLDELVIILSKPL